MLGDLIYEAKGKVTGRRVLDTEGPTIEGTYSTQGKIKGIDVMEMGTFSSTMRPGGALYGEDKAVLMTPEGDMASVNPKGIGRFTGPGAISYRGCAIFNANATGKLVFLSNAVLVVDVEIDASDNMTIKAWEWK
jgi:hypothetical protein